jgi:hypothetical protein
MSLTEERLEKFPAWREALELFRAENFPYGHILTHEWLYKAFGIRMPEPSTPWRLAKVTQVEYMENVIRFREALQLEDLLYLETAWALGYRIVPPSEQTARAMALASARMNKALRRAARTVGNIRVQELSEQERRENTDARAKISSIAGLAKRIEAPF